jgi:hypothetical protein
MTSPARSPAKEWGPWAAGDVFAPAMVNGLALLGLIVTWWGAASEAHWHSGLFWLQGAIVAAVVASVANATFLLKGLRQLRERRRALVLCWPTLLERWSNGPRVATEGVFVTAPRMTTYHLPSCLLMQGKPLREDGRHDFERNAYSACGMCIA